MICVVTGADGSGKSTACKNIAKQIESQLGSGTVGVVSIWDSVNQSQLFASKQDVVHYLNDLDGYTRTLFLFHALSRSIDLAQRKKPKIIVVDGYWYKYAVSEIGQGVSIDDVLAAARGFVPPNIVFCLDIDPQISKSRKSEVSQYEQGSDTQGAAFDRFLQFQNRLAPIWIEIEKRSGPWIHLSSQLDLLTLSEMISKQCLQEVDLHASG